MSVPQTLIIRTPRKEVSDLVKSVTNPLGTFKSAEAANVGDCIDELVKDASAMLVVDWQLGSQEVNQILGAIRRHFKVEVRSILLIIDEITPEIVATAIEYGVSQIHSGPLTGETMGSCLKVLIDEAQHSNPIRDTLLQVAVAREKGNWTFVTPVLQNLLDQNPGNTRVAMELAENLIVEKNWDDALSILAPLVATEIPHIRALHLMGRCYLGQGKADEAIKTLSKAKLFNPDNLDRLIDLGHAFMANDQPSEAKAEFNQVLSIDSEYSDAIKGKGQAMLMSGEVNEGLALLKVTSGNREIASVFNTAAILTVRHQHFDKGRDLYIAALKALGSDTTIASRLFYNLGLAYLKWSKPEKAQAAFDRSFKLDPTFSKVQKHVDTLKETPIAAEAPPTTTLGTEDFQEEEVVKAQPPDPNDRSGVGSRVISSDGIITEDTEEDDWSPIDPAA